MLVFYLASDLLALHFVQLGDVFVELVLLHLLLYFYLLLLLGLERQLVLGLDSLVVVCLRLGDVQLGALVVLFVVELLFLYLVEHFLVEDLLQGLLFVELGWLED